MPTTAKNRLLLETFLSATLGTVFIFPFIILLYILNQIWRFILSSLLSFIYGDEIILNPTGYDGMYMYFGHPHGKRTVLYLATLDNPIDIHAHRGHYEKHIVNENVYGKLRKIWIKKWGYHCLKEDLQFDIKNHVRIYGNEDHIVTEEELMGTILPELSEDLGSERPQWEDIIIPKFRYSAGSPAGFDDSVKSIRIFRIHHGYMDGISNLMMLAYSQSEGQKFPWVIDPLAKQGNQTPLQKIIFYGLCALNFSGGIMKNIIDKPSSIRNRWHVKKFTGKTLHGWSSPLEMSVLKQIKNHSRTSMPAVVCSILAGAVRRYEKEYESPEEEFKGKLSDEIIVGLVAAALPYPSLELRNNHCILKCHLDTGKFKSSLERLQAIQNEMKRLSKLPDVYLNRLMPRLFGEMPGWFSDACTALISGCGVVSNFPATDRKVELWGNKVNEMAGWVPLLTPAGFACVTLRYADHLRFSINCDSAAMSQNQLDFFLKCVSKEAQLLSMESSCPKLPKLQAITKMPLLSISSGNQIGRFIVSKVDQNYKEDETERNNNYKEDKNYENSRERRLQYAIEKILRSVNKLKRA